MKIVDAPTEGNFMCSSQEIVDIAGVGKKLNLIGTVQETNQTDIKISGTVGEKSGLWLPSKGDTINSSSNVGRACKAANITDFDPAGNQFVGKLLPVKKDDKGRYWRLNV